MRTCLLLLVVAALVAALPFKAELAQLELEVASIAADPAVHANAHAAGPSVGDAADALTSAPVTLAKEDDSAQAAATGRVVPPDTRSGSVTSPTNYVVLLTLTVFFGGFCLVLALGAIMLYRAQHAPDAYKSLDGGASVLSPRQKVVLLLLSLATIAATVTVASVYGVQLAQATALTAAGATGTGTGTAARSLVGNQAADLLAQHNAIRAQNGRAPLITNAGLQAASEHWSVVMDQNSCLAHPGQCGLRRGGGSCCLGSSLGAELATYAPKWDTAAGHNVGMGQQDVPSIIAGWRNSPAHFANMIDARFSDIGCGVQNFMWTCTFAHFAPSCFGADAAVTVNGAAARMADLRIGDAVADLEGSTVFLGWIKKEANNRMWVNELHYSVANSTRVLTLSPNHFVYVLDRASGARTPVHARTVRVGDRLVVPGHADGVPVVALFASETRGVYAPLTASGTLLVDGVLCSNYAEFPASDLPLVHATLAPMRALYKLLPESLWSRIAAVEDGFHWFPRTLLALHETVLGARPLSALLPERVLALVASA